MRSEAAVIVFVLICPVPSGAQGHFTMPAYQQLNISNVSEEPLIVDVNADGSPDIVREGYYLNGLITILGPAFAAPLTSPGGTSVLDTAVPIAASDLDGNSTIDIITYSNNGIRNYMGLGNGVFIAAPQPVPGTANRLVTSFAVADLDADGNPEIAGILAVPNTQTSTVWMATNTAGNWTTVSSNVVPLNGVFLACGDVNGDAALDIVLVGLPGSPSGGSWVLRNLGSAWTFALQGPYPCSCNFYGGRVGDLDGDGCSDLVMSYGGLTYSRGDTSGALSPPQAIPQPSFQAPGYTFYTQTRNSPVLRDFDGDGLIDVLWTTEPVLQPPGSPATLELVGRLYLCRGNLLSTIPITMDFGTGVSFGSLGAADFDNDGDQDILVTIDRSWTGVGGPADFGIAWNQSQFGAGVAGSVGVPTFFAGSAFPGNGAFSVGLDMARPCALAVLGISFGAGMIGTPAGAIWLDLSPPQLVSPSSSFGMFMTDVNGRVYVPIPIPPGAGPQGLELFAQWAVDDPLGAYLLPGPPFSLSPARKIILWL